MNYIQENSLYIYLAILAFILLAKLYHRFKYNRNFYKNTILKEKICPFCHYKNDKNYFNCKSCGMAVDQRKIDLVCYNCGFFGEFNKYKNNSEYIWTLLFLFVFPLPLPILFALYYRENFANKKICPKCGRIKRIYDYKNINQINQISLLNDYYKLRKIFLTICRTIYKPINTLTGRLNHAIYNCSLANKIKSRRNNSAKVVHPTSIPLKKDLTSNKSASDLDMCLILSFFYTASIEIVLYQVSIAVKGWLILFTHLPGLLILGFLHLKDVNTLSLVFSNFVAIFIVIFFIQFLLLKIKKPNQKIKVD